jgi:hypothetical protein
MPADPFHSKPQEEALCCEECREWEKCILTAPLRQLEYCAHGYQCPTCEYGLPDGSCRRQRKCAECTAHGVTFQVVAHRCGKCIHAQHCLRQREHQEGVDLSVEYQHPAYCRDMTKPCTTCPAQENCQPIRRQVNAAVAAMRARKEIPMPTDELCVAEPRGALEAGGHGERVGLPAPSPQPPRDP